MSPVRVSCRGAALQQADHILARGGAVDGVLNIDRIGVGVLQKTQDLTHIPHQTPVVYKAFTGDVQHIFADSLFPQDRLRLPVMGIEQSAQIGRECGADTLGVPVFHTVGAVTDHIHKTLGELMAIRRRGLPHDRRFVQCDHTRIGTRTAIQRGGPEAAHQTEHALLGMIDPEAVGT